MCIIHMIVTWAYMIVTRAYMIVTWTSHDRHMGKCCTKLVRDGKIVRYVLQLSGVITSTQRYMYM